MMQPHPDFAQTALPRTADLGDYRLSPLSPAQVDEDFAAVTGSARVLRGHFGDDWPDGLTREENLIDMGWHEREFTTRRSFAWIIRDPGGTYLGCAYLYPEPGMRGHGKVVTWMCDTPGRRILLAAFNTAFDTWLRPFLPEGYAVTWNSNDQP
jgi:hypothetical protein